MPELPGTALSPAVARLEGALVVACDDAGTIAPLTVVVVGERIAAVGEPDAMRARFPAADAIDCTGRVLLPGLVNAHLHAELHVLKGAVEELGLHDWEEADAFDGALGVLSATDGRWIQRAAIRAALADSLLSGTTGVGTYGVTLGADEVAREEIPALGLRGLVTIRDPGFGARAYDPVVPHVYRLHAEEALTEAELAAAAIAHARGDRLVMHAAETEHRISLARERFGASTIRLLEARGLLSPRMLLSHAVHVDEEERALVAARGAPVLSSPAAELKLADGIAPVADYLQRGATVALGTDAAVCNNGNDMFLEMRQLGLVQKLRWGAAAMPAEQILRMATRHGARVLYGSGRAGMIAEGRLADLVLVNLGTLRMQPAVHRDGHSNVAANLVYAATGQDVTDVMIGGRWIVRGRRLRTAEEDAVVEALARAATALYDRIP